MATRDQIRRFVEGTRPKDWYGQCAGLTYRTIADCGGYAPDIYGSAFAAYSVAKIESKDASKAPAGAIHYWDYYGTDNRGVVNRWGHVAIDIDGGGRNVLSATGHAHENWGVRAGLITVASQTGRAGMVYLGWSLTYGLRNRLTIGADAPAGGGAKPLPTPNPTPAPTPAYQQESKMFIAKVKNGKGANDFAYFLVIPTGAKMRAVILGSEGYRENVKEAPLPIITFVWQPSIDALKAAVDGVNV